MAATVDGFNLKLGEDIEKVWHWKEIQRIYEKHGREWQVHFHFRSRFLLIFDRFNKERNISLIKPLESEILISDPTAKTPCEPRGLKSLPKIINILTL